MKKKVVLVDDEEDARELVKFHLNRHSTLKLVGEANNGLDAIQLIESTKPDIVLLDIQMPELNGLDVVKKLLHNPLFIFITAYDEYAIKAFELNAVDYLLKPFSAIRFDASIKRSLDRLAQGLVEKDHYRLLLNEINQNSTQDSNYVNRIAYKSDNKTFYINTSDIILIEAADQYVNIHTHQKKYLIRQSMDYLEEILDPGTFFRTHRSYIINIEEVTSTEQFGSRVTWVYLRNGMKVKLSQVRKQLFLNKLNLG